MTDAKRREVARRLRGIKDTREGCGHDLCCDLWSAIFDSDYRCTDLCDECEVAVLNSLADLIEPGSSATPPRHVTDASATVGASQMEQLLALADELEAEGLDGWASGPVAVGRYARRIREALGVEP